MLTARQWPATRPFSILYRIELGGTRPAGWKYLPNRSFSILYQIELGGTSVTTHQKTFCGLTFSILYRIELGGTQPGSSVDLLASDFQYPLSDRVGWNAGGRADARFRRGLSVSSIGSSWVEL